ncbi:MAG TPA: DMT family transporter [Polyangiales bacterium]
MSEQRLTGIAWAVGSALGSAAFLIPWKLAASVGTARVNLLLLLVAAAVLNSVALPFLPRARSAQSGAPARRRALWLAAQLSVLTLLGNWASAMAIGELSAPVLSVLQRTEVLVVALLAWLWLGERIDARFGLGTLIAGAGLLFIQNDALHGRAGAVGTFYGLLAAASFGTMIVLARRAGQAIDPVSVNAQRLWLSVALWFVINGVPGALWKITAQQLLYAALAALCGPVLSRVCIMYSVRYVEARVSALTILCAPVLTLWLSHLWFGGLPGTQQLLGGLLMLTGIALPISGWKRA